MNNIDIDRDRLVNEILSFDRAVEALSTTGSDYIDKQLGDIKLLVK